MKITRIVASAANNLPQLISQNRSWRNFLFVPHDLWPWPEQGLTQIRWLYYIFIPDLAGDLLTLIKVANFEFMRQTAIIKPVAVVLIKRLALSSTHIRG